MVDDEIKYVPEPRNQHDDGVLTYSITHTERFFPTPLRESKQMDEENWLAKNASHVGRRLGEKRKPGDSRDISERDPFWLKGKGDDFFRAKDYKSAISAYSSAYEIDEGMTAALSNRAACHLLLAVLRLLFAVLCLLPAATCLLPAAYCLMPDTYWLLAAVSPLLAPGC